jgi:lantibiotic modifying enzyme
MGDEFKVGKEYRFHQAASKQEYLDAVLGAEKMLRKKCVETGDGIYWQDVLQDEPDRAFYSGSAGVLYFYIKLYKALNRESDKKIIDGAVDYLVNTWKEFKVADMSSPLPEADNGFYTGLVALTIPLIEAYDIEADTARKETIKAAVSAITEEVLRRASTEDGKLFWRKNLAMFYDGGVVLQLLQVAEFLDDKALTEKVVESGRYLADTAYKHKEGGLVYDGYNGGNPYVAPNFEFGSAGAGFTLLRLYEVSGDKAFLDKAISCAEFLDKISIRQKKGILIPYRYGGADKTIFYLGSCHGPAGTGKFFYKLYKVTKDEKYLRQLYSLYDGLEALGGPGKMSEGLWNCINLCCGAAGHVQVYVALYVSTKEEKWLELARKSAGILLGEKETTEDGAAYWEVALDRVSPEVFTVPVGYYDGIAGIASALLQIYLVEEGKFDWKRLVDDPFDEKQ